MLQIIRNDFKIDFVRYFIPCIVISTLLVSLSLIGAATKMNYGVDFRGGAEIQVKFNQAVPLDALRSHLSKKGFEGVVAQTIGEAQDNEFLIKVQADENNLNQITQKIDGDLKQSFSEQGVEIRKIDIVGPKAGAELRTSGFLAMAWAILAIMIYIALRFDLKFAPGAIVALVHDSAIVLGFYVLTGTSFTLQTVAAILAVIGYSVNDTVIIYDRVRENETKYGDRSLNEQINLAINETLSRTIITAGATLLTALGLLFFGGEAIRDFSLAMSVGIVAGSYSTIYIASPITLFFDNLEKKKKKVEVTALKA